VAPTTSCVHDGYTYNKGAIPREPHYSDSTIGLFVPHGYRRTPILRELCRRPPIGGRNRDDAARLAIELPDHQIGTGAERVRAIVRPSDDSSVTLQRNLVDRVGSKRIVSSNTVVC
jgi:hypothetical protein